MFFTKRENMINLDACYMIGNFWNIKDFLIFFFFFEVLIIPFWDFFGKLLCTSNNTSTISIFCMLYISCHMILYFWNINIQSNFNIFKEHILWNPNGITVFKFFFSKAHLKYGLKDWFFSQKCIMLQNNWNFELGDD